MSAPERRASSPTEALELLLAGNQRFVTGTRIHPHQDAEYRASLAKAQRPYAVLFGCSDSRLAAEIIFDCGLGDLFVVRTAGHIMGPEVLASIEFGVTELGAALVVVLGHDSCGAVEAAMATTRSSSPNLQAIVDRVLPSVEEARAHHVTDPDRISDVHVRHTIEAIIRDSTAMSVAVADGSCAVVGMSYRLADGRATVITAAPVAPAIS